MNKIEKLEDEIENILRKSPLSTDIDHGRSARDWVLKLKPDASSALQIAALAHDVERGYQKDEANDVLQAKENFDNYDELKRIHSEKSAKIIVELLEKYNFDKDFVYKVKDLVLKHEFGGDEDSDVLKDADSLSFFQHNFEYYFEKYGAEKGKEKIRFMYNRMSDKAKELIKEIKFQNEELERIFKEETNK